MRGYFLAVAELGYAGNDAGISCREYSYVKNAVPSGCSESSSSSWPTGNTNNGNVAGYYYNDTMGLGHTAGYQLQ